MNQQEITEGNKLIAEFMSKENPFHYGRYIVFNGFAYTPDEMKFNSSWDWLMPVVGKITKQCEEPDELDGLKYALLCNDIKGAWQFVVDYLDNLRGGKL